MGVTAFKMPVGGAWESPRTLLFPNIDARQIAAYAHEQNIHALEHRQIVLQELGLE